MTFIIHKDFCVYNFIGRISRVGGGLMTVGQNVREAVDLMEKGLPEIAFAKACAAIGKTILKSVEKTNLSDDDYQRFIKENWQLISFMSLPQALPLPMNVPFGLKRIVPRFNIHHGAEEIVSLVINQTLFIGKLPPEFALNSNGFFEVKDNKLFLPNTLLGGLLGIVIVQPINKDETVPGKYWMNIADFKMFTSELWGRIDLAERIMKFHLEDD